MPANVVMTVRRLICGHVSNAFSRTCASASAVVATSSGSAVSCAVGPSSMVLCAVGLTSTPLPILVGV